MDDLRLKFGSRRARLGDFAPPSVVEPLRSAHTLSCPEAMWYRIASVHSWPSIPLPYPWQFAIPPGEGEGLVGQVVRRDESGGRPLGLVPDFGFDSSERLAQCR